MKRSHSFLLNFSSIFSFFFYRAFYRRFGLKSVNLINLSCAFFAYTRGYSSCLFVYVFLLILAFGSADSGNGTS